MKRWGFVVAAVILLGLASLAIALLGTRNASQERSQGGSPEGTPAISEEASPEVEYITSQVTEGLGLPFSEAVRIGDLLLLSGMIGTRPGTLELVSGGIEAESRQALENIHMILESSGASLDDVVKCTVMLDDIGQWTRFNQIYLEFFGDNRPARSAFGADGLALGSAVEIECVAVVQPQ